MALMSDVDLPVAHVRAQVASAIDLVVHTARLRDAGGSVFQIAGVDDLDGAGEPVVIEVYGQRDHSRGQARAHERTVPADPGPDFSSQETSNLEFSAWRLRPRGRCGRGRTIARTGRTAMRKLIVQQWVTVDNIAAEEDGGLSFVSGSPSPRPPTLRSRRA
jgi:hypothetical protein